MLDKETLASISPERLAHLPSNTVEAEVFLRRASDAERKITKLRRDLQVERQQRSLVEEEAAVLARRLEVLEAFESTEPVIEHIPREKHSGNHGTAFLALNDWHLEERVDPSTVNDLNAYDPEIASARIDRVVSRFLMLLESTRSLTDIDQIVIGVLGDMITGYIHQDLVEGNYMSPTEALLLVRDKLHSCIDTIAKESGVSEIIIPTCIGNHGRTTDKSRIHTAHQNSYEWLLYKWMEKDYRNDPRIKWKVSDSYFNLLQIQGKSIRLHHGDAMRGGGGVGGITVPVLRAIGKWNPVDFDIFGHFHQFVRLPKAVCCNALIGYNAFAQRIAGYSPPSQTYMVFDSKRPGAVDVREIFCD